MTKKKKLADAFWKERIRGDNYKEALEEVLLIISDVVKKTVKENK